VDSSQVTDLLSRTHTCLWEWEGSFSSCRGFRLFSDRLIGGGKGGGLSTALRSGLRCGGLESKFGWDLDPSTGVEWVGIVCAWGTSEACVFGGTQLGYSDSRIIVSM
jgi:hypothetical protein